MSKTDVFGHPFFLVPWMLLCYSNLEVIVWAMEIQKSISLHSSGKI